MGSRSLASTWGPVFSMLLVVAMLALASNWSLESLLVVMAFTPLLILLTQFSAGAVFGVFIMAGMVEVGEVRIAAVLAVALLAVALWRVLDSGLPEIPITTLLFAGLVIVVAAGAAFSSMPDYAIEKVARLGTLGVTAFLVPPILMRDSREVARFAAAVVAIGIVLSCAAAAISLASGAQRFAGLGAETLTIARAASLSVVGLCTFAFNRSSYRAVLVALAGVCTWVLIATGSRGPLLGLIIAAVATVGMYMVQKRITVGAVVVGLAGVGVGLAGLAVVSPSQATQRILMVFSSNPGTSVLVRLRFLEGSWRLFKSSPILGRGTGGFAGVSNLRYPHNVFAELASENGIVPVVLLMALVIQAIRLATRAMGGLRDSVGDFVFGGLLLSLVNALFSGDLTTNQPLYAFAAIAAVLAATVSGSECAAARSSGSVASDHGVLSSGESRA